MFCHGVESRESQQVPVLTYSTPRKAGDKEEDSEKLGCQEERHLNEYLMVFLISNEFLNTQWKGSISTSECESALFHRTLQSINLDSLQRTPQLPSCKPTFLIQKNEFNQGLTLHQNTLECSLTQTLQSPVTVREKCKGLD